MALPTRVTSLFVQYGIPLAFAAAYLFLRVIPSDGSYWQVIWLVLGFYLGFLLLWIDEKFLYSRYNNLQTLPKELITRSVLFALAYVVLLIFVVTSTGSPIGVGMVLGVGTQLSIEHFLARKNPEYFQKKFLFQMKRQLQPIEIARMMLLFAGVVVLMAGYYLFK
ncbi:MAG: hypothetical protein WDZ94_01565 [Patescibacteria group bacterium]